MVSPPRKPKNQEVRSREHLTPDEVDQLMQAAKQEGRNGHRDATLILLMYRHGLRVSEAIALRWDQVDLKQGTLHVNRMKRGTPATHPLRGPELRALRQLKREYADSPYLFQSERKGPMSDRTARAIIARAGELAKLPFPVHPHMLRHAAKSHKVRQVILTGLCLAEVAKWSLRLKCLSNLNFVTEYFYSKVKVYGVR